MSDLDDLRAFVSVLDHGSFSRAARALGLANSIISRRIARLEADLGVPLLHRTTRGVSATDAGLEYQRRGAKVLSDLAEARDVVTRARDGVVGRLRVSLPLSFGVRYITPILCRLANEHAGLELDISYSDRLSDLVGERFDVAVRLGNLKDSTLVSRRLGPVTLSLVASPGYCSTHAAPETPDDLAEHECVLYSGPRERPPWSFMQSDRRWSVQPSGRVQADNGEALLQMALGGLGIALLPDFLAAQPLRSGQLVAVLPNFKVPEEGVFVVRPPASYVSTPLKVVTDELVALFARGMPWDEI